MSAFPNDPPSYPSDMPSYAPAGDSPMAGIGQIPAAGAPLEAPPPASPPYAPTPAGAAWDPTPPCPAQPPHTPLGGGFDQPLASPYPPAGPWGLPATTFEQTGDPGSTPSAPAPTKNRLGIIALVCGIAMVPLLAVIGTVSGRIDTSGLTAVWLLLATCSIVFGVLGVRAAGRGEATNKGMAIAGMAIGIALIGLLVFAGLTF